MEMTLEMSFLIKFGIGTYTIEIEQRFTSTFYAVHFQFSPITICSPFLTQFPVIRLYANHRQFEFKMNFAIK